MIFSVSIVTASSLSMWEDQSLPYRILDMAYQFCTISLVSNILLRSKQRTETSKYKNNLKGFLTVDGKYLNPIRRCIRMAKAGLQSQVMYQETVNFSLEAKKIVQKLFCNIGPSVWQWMLDILLTKCKRDLRQNKCEKNTENTMDWTC